MSEILVLRLVHVVGGMFWVGSMLFTTFFLLPSLAKTPHAPLVFAGLQQRKLFVVLPVVSLLTILSGTRLMQIMSGGFSAAYFQSPAGRTFAWAGTFAIAGFLIGLAIVRPAAARGARLGAQLATADGATRDALLIQCGRMQRINRIGSVIVTTLIVAAAVGMSVARYV